MVKTNVNKAFHENQEVKNLEKIPMVGKQISKTLESSVGDITYKVIEAMITSLAKQDNRKMIHQFTHAALDNIEKQNKENQELEKLIKQIIVDSLDVINEEVSVKKWKTRQKIYCGFWGKPYTNCLTLFMYIKQKMIFLKAKLFYN